MSQDLQCKVGESDRRQDSAPPADAIRDELEKILSSRTFRSAQSQRSFLRYAVEEAIAGRGNLIKEYMIGMEALGRGESFDPRLDPIVRTQARKLRARLGKYYETEGENDPLRIDLPKGSYSPSFRKTDPPGSSAPRVPVAVAADASAAPNAYSSRVAIPTPETRPPWRRTVITLVFVFLAACCSFVLYLFSDSGGGVRSADRRSIAILPLTNLSDDKEDEFLSDGLTQDLIDSLAQVPDLRVVARTSAVRFKERNADIREIGQKLNVRTVLVGSVRKSANRMLVTVQLNNAADGYHLWSGSYDREANDTQMIQKEISRAITDVLGVRLADGQELPKILPNQASPNRGAYQNYLKGLYFWNKLTVDGLKAAVQYFEEAITEDPSFARAYAALAYCYVMSPQVATSPPPEVVSKIKFAASKAQELDSTLGEAHILLAIGAEYEFDWASAEREFKKGLELCPGNAVGHLWYAKYLALLNKKQEVLEQRRIAAELDPASPYALGALAWCFLALGRYDDAIEQFQNALPLEPNFAFTHQGLGTAYLRKGMRAEAIEELQLASKLMDGPRRLSYLGYAYAVSGNTGEARRILNGFLEQNRRGPFPAMAIALIYVGLGDTDRAFEWLENSIGQRDLNLYLQWDWFYEPLRSDPRFAKLLRRMKLT